MKKNVIVLFHLNTHLSVLYLTVPLCGRFGDTLEATITIQGNAETMDEFDGACGEWARF